MKNINALVFNPNNLDVSDIISDHNNHDEATLCHIDDLLGAENGQITLIVEHDTWKNLSNSLMSITDKKRDLIFKFFIIENGGRTERVLISDGFYHSVGL